MTKNHHKRKGQKITQAQLRELGSKLVARHRNFYVYVIFGFLAAVINIACFLLFHNVWKIPVIYANTVAFIISNLASFFLINMASSFKMLISSMALFTNYVYSLFTELSV